MTKAGTLLIALTLFAFASIMFSGCSENSGTSAGDPQTEQQIPSDTGINILTSVFPSPKEQNPYSVENMNKTFRNFILANNAKAKDIPKLEANFLYVRFLPYGRQGAYELRTYDSSLVLFRHPMDYNDIRKPVVYIDESLPDSIIPYFASVPVGYEFGSTPYEILQELFLPQALEEDDEDNEDYQEGSRFVMAKKSNKANKAVSDYLKSQGLTPSQLEAIILPSERLNAEMENNSSRILAKNIPIDIDNIFAWSLFPKRWRPSGTLTFTDTSFINKASGEELKRPLVGVRVTAGYWYYWRSSRTNEKGYFQSPERWTFSVDYEANFDSDQFLLEDGHSWYGEDLEIEKNNKKSAWSENFTGNHAKWCVVWTAAWNYWYGEIYGLHRPRQNEWWNQSLDIRVYYKNKKDFEDDTKEGINGRYRNILIIEDIFVLAYDRTHLQIYGTTTHEIAHSSHYWNGKAIFEMNNITYGILSDILKETYARGIQRYLTSKHYGAWDTTYIIGEYTGLFEDLEDSNVAFAKLSKYNNDKYCDRVSGITVPMAEKALFKSLSWDGFLSSFKKKLMEDYPNETINEEGGKASYTSADMNGLFDYWEKGKESPCPVSSSSSAIPSSSSTTPSSNSVIPSSSSVLPSSSSVPPSSSSAIPSSSSTSTLSSSSSVPPSSSSVMVSSSSLGDGPGPSFTDTRDGYVYKTTKIDSQVWLAENLRYNAPGSQCNDGNPANCEIYGRLYDWATAMNLPANCNTISCSSQIKNSHQGVCPDGWHLPTLAEWNKLIIFADGEDGPDADYETPYSSLSSGKLLAKSSLWRVYHSGGGPDYFGFSALPGGYDNSYIEGICAFWGTTEWLISSTGGLILRNSGDDSNDDSIIYYDYQSYDPSFAVSRSNYIGSRGMGYYQFKTSRLSVRCVKN